MSRCYLLVCSALLFATNLVAQPNGKLQNSVVRITATDVEPDYKAPWNSGAVQRGTGAGFLIDGGRIMTNAHVVSNSRYLTVERDGDPNKYPATVLFVAHDCDLALIKVASPDFGKNMAPLTFGGIPELESTVSAYGYPIGGQRMSVTTGIVSRVDFQLYTHSSIDQHLAIQISAQINPGNSGGPVMQNGKVVGVAFQGYSGDVAQGVAYMIPTPVITRFLKDVTDGRYDRYVDLGVTYSKLQNPAQRRFLGLQDDDRGVLVNSVIAGGTSSKVLQSGDVLLSIDNLPIASDSFVELEGARVEMPEVVERKFKGDKVKLDIVRDKKPMSVTVELEPLWPYLFQGHSYDVQPRYIVFGGLLFQPLSLDLMQAYQPQDLRLRHYFDFFVSEQIYLRHREIIVLTNILPDPINTYLSPYRASIVNEVNGKQIRTLNDLAQAFAETTDQIVIRMVGDGPPLVLDRERSRRRARADQDPLQRRAGAEPQRATAAEAARRARGGAGPMIALRLLIAATACALLCVNFERVRKSIPLACGRASSTAARPAGKRLGNQAKRSLARACERDGSTVRLHAPVAEEGAVLKARARRCPAEEPRPRDR
jgi:S1-C subfamily serine protease